jgi:2C-methyl-D-erythritol 2,4-cyclodiphosphate synthase
MNAKLTLIALAGALFSTAALADLGTYAAPTEIPATSKTRAEVRAELAAQPPLLQGDRYPVTEIATSQRTREEVRAEARHANPLQGGA